MRDWPRRGKDDLRDYDPSAVDSEDRNKTPETEEFDKITECQADIASLDERGKIQVVDTAHGDVAHDAAYRHYDDLIWRVPLWGTGVFSATMIGLNSATQAFISKMTRIDEKYIAVSYLTLMFLVMLAFSFALNRFRVRQRQAVQNTTRRRTAIWKSASSYFNFLISIETFAVLSGALLMGGLPMAWSLAGCAAAAVALAIIYEMILRRTQTQSLQ